MSARERKVQDVDSEPINFYYQYKKPDKPHDKVKVITKGQQWKGVYQYMFVDEEYENSKTHLLRTEAEGKITIKGATSLNNKLASLGFGKEVRIVYLGTGKRKPGRKPPYLFDVFEVLPEDAPKAKLSSAKMPELDDQADESFDPNERAAADDSNPFND
jgi:hypothetical protein